MFQPGDLVVYGAAGVCRVEELTQLAGDGGVKRDCYLLKPLRQDGVIYTPVDNQKVPIRPVLSAEEAEDLIDRIPTIQAAEDARDPARRYQSALRSGDCQDLVGVMKSIGSKRRQAEARKRPLAMADERCLRQAERKLFGELSAALDIPFEEVASYIDRRTAAQNF